MPEDYNRRLGPRPQDPEEMAKQVAEIAANLRVAEGLRPYYLTKLTNDWLPLPAPIIKELDLKEGDELECFVTHNQLIVRKAGSTAEETPTKKGRKDIDD